MTAMEVANEKRTNSSHPKAIPGTVASRATAIVEASQRATDEPDWQCRQCQSANPATFDSCWHCGGNRD